MAFFWSWLFDFFDTVTLIWPGTWKLGKTGCTASRVILVPPPDSWCRDCKHTFYYPWPFLHEFWQFNSGPYVAQQTFCQLNHHSDPSIFHFLNTKIQTLNLNSVMDILKSWNRNEIKFSVHQFSTLFMHSFYIDFSVPIHILKYILYCMAKNKYKFI